jgi:hypothetical protein
MRSFIIVGYSLLNNIRPIKSRITWVWHVVHMRGEKNYSENLKGRYHSGDLGVGVRIILKLILERA